MTVIIILHNKETRSKHSRMMQQLKYPVQEAKILLTSCSAVVSETSVLRLVHSPKMATFTFSLAVSEMENVKYKRPNSSQELS